MRRFFRLRYAALFLGLGAGLFVREAKADPAFVYVNANPNQTQNSVAALRVAGNVATAVPGSPFATGGLGLGLSPGADFTHRVVIAQKRNLLFASNDGSGSIAAFTINPATGSLTPVPGSPFVIPGWGAFSGISLAISLDGRFLYASGKNVTSLSIADSGALSEIGARWGFVERVAGIAVDPNNARLFLSMASGAVVLRTGSAGLTADPPDILSVGSTVTDLGLSANGKRFWLTTNAGVQSYGYDSNGFSSVPGSPFFPGVSSLGGVSVDSRDRFLIANSPSVPRLLSATINTDGSLGSALAVSPTFRPLAAALSPEGGVVFAADTIGQLDAWTTASDGTLTHLAGFPTLTGSAPGFPSVATLPAQNPVPGAPLTGVLILSTLLLLVGLVQTRRRHHARRDVC